MPKDTGAPIVCKLCGIEKPATSFYVARGYRNVACMSCRSEQKRRRYHTNARARAVQIASSVGTLVKKKFPEADTGLTSAAYADALLAAVSCTYCGQPNDGTHPFNLDHRVALGNGGKHELANLVPCCEPCNRAKRDMPADTFVAWLRGVAQRMAGGSVLFGVDAESIQRELVEGSSLTPERRAMFALVASVRPKHLNLKH